MLFSSPDYPLFLIAVFFLYALARGRPRRGRLARVALMVLLGDLVFLLVAKDPDALWDPIGGALLAAGAAGGSDDAGRGRRWSLALGVGAARARRRDHRSGGAGPAWIASERGQRVDRARHRRRARARRRDGRRSRSHAGRARRASPRRSSRTATCSCSRSSASRSARRARGRRAARARRRAVRRVVPLLSRVGGGDAGPLSLPARAAARHDRPRLLPRALDRAAPTIRRGARRSLIVSLCSNLGILVFFKYANFFTQDVLAPRTSSRCT